MLWEPVNQLQPNALRLRVPNLTRNLQQSGWRNFKLSHDARLHRALLIDKDNPAAEETSRLRQTEGLRLAIVTAGPT